MLSDLQPPPAEPATLEEAKTYLRIDHSDEDALIQTLIASAREQLEARLGIAMITRPMQMARSGGGNITLPRWPVSSVDAVLADGTPSPDYSANLRCRPSTVDVCASDHVEIAFTAGYGLTPDSVPTPLRQAVLLMVAYAYEHRGDGQGEGRPGTVPLMVDALTMPYRVVGL